MEGVRLESLVSLIVDMVILTDSLFLLRQTCWGSQTLDRPEGKMQVVKRIQYPHQGSLIDQFARQRGHFYSIDYGCVVRHNR